MSKKEKIVCAAVRFEREYEASGIEIKNDVLCVNYEDNRIEEARFSFENSTYIVVNREVNGFITNKNRFVDPVEAMKIAIDVGQFEYLAYKDMEIKILERMKLTTQAGISKKLRGEWVEVVSDRGLLPEDLY